MIAAGGEKRENCPTALRSFHPEVTRVTPHILLATASRRTMSNSKDQRSTWKKRNWKYLCAAILSNHFPQGMGGRIGAHNKGGDLLPL